MSQQLHGWADSTASAAGLRSLATAFLISLCIHAVLVVAVWRFASSQQRQPVQRELRVELTSGPQPTTEVAPVPVHSEPRLDSSERGIKGRSDRLSRTRTSAVLPATQSSVPPEGGSITSSSVADAEVPPGGERRELNDNARPIDLRVLEWLAHYRSYPLEARRARIEGVVQLRVTLMSDGRLVDARVEQSSGHRVLDRAALDLLARASPLPDEFASVGQVELQLPIVYRMRAPSS